MRITIQELRSQKMALLVWSLSIGLLIAACVICIIRNRKPRANNDSAHAAK